MMTTTMLRRIERLEAQQAARKPWSAPCTPPQPSVAKLRWVMERLWEMGALEDVLARAATRPTYLTILRGGAEVEVAPPREPDTRYTHEHE